MTNKTTSAIDLVERVARAISIPEHHTSWDTLSETEKDLYRMQAEYAVKAFDTEQADTITRLQAALEPFARIADKGKHGGRFLIASASYLLANGKLDATPRESHWHWDDFERARDAYRSSVGGE